MPYAGGVDITDGLNRQIDFSGGYAWKNGAYINLSGQWLKRDGSNRSGLDNIPLIYYGNAGSLPPGAAVPPGVHPTDYYRWLIDKDNAFSAERKYDRRNIVAGNSSANNLGAFLNAGFTINERQSLYHGGRFTPYRCCQWFQPQPQLLEPATGDWQMGNVIITMASCRRSILRSMINH